MNKIVHLGSGPYGGIFCRIKIKDGNLSITGVEGPLRNGDARGACGQIVMHGFHLISYAPGWSAPLVQAFRVCWERWHLNDMQAACEHQRARGETWTTHPSATCPDCGYRLGQAWLMEELPPEVVAFLESLPETDIQPAWI